MAIKEFQVLLPIVSCRVRTLGKSFT